ncbi:hypothetical protein K435DRAFT_973836 [Dendrothele bispora CBS 962.96]|uniref:Uncharacterized protein n=1 Tax=Dendrothele bispora (strain CBS 962.96) TaxID=1314807 RepID=A0A4S8KPY9_DENBC|nr:hypothetical protein K435DRAFT_973836 [Dendrothele bispora CBS 962.96]
MSTLVDKASAGTLTPNFLEEQIMHDPSIIDKPGGSMNYTPLTAAVVGGHLDAVELLLGKQANPDAVSASGLTPLLYATSKKLGANQVAIVSALLRAHAEVDKSDKIRGDNTPLMNAIAKIKDKAVVQELVKYGADPKRKNAKGKSAEDLAKEYGMTRDLRPREERAATRGYFIDLIVSMFLFVVALVDNGGVKGAVKGAITNVYHIFYPENAPAAHKKTFDDLRQKIDSNKLEGSTATDQTKDATTSSQNDIQTGGSNDNLKSRAMPQGSEPITQEQLEQALGDFLDENDLTRFFKPGDPFLENLAQKAVALSKDADSIYSNPDNVKRLTRLSLYQSVIYCDDSGSMEGERFTNQGELVERIARIATRIVPEDCGVDLRFINSDSDVRLSFDNVATTMSNFRPAGGTKIGTNLVKKILDPLIYKNLDSDSLKRPLLVCIITDGCPSNEPQDKLKKAIVECRSKLATSGYESTAVMFLISQIGNDAQAETFLEQLRNDDGIKDMLYCTADRLDEKFKELKEAENRLEEWLLKTLTSPIMASD